MIDVQITRLHLPLWSDNRPRTLLEPQGIGVHRTGNPRPGADARMHWEYFRNDPDADASYNYISDDTGIYELIPPTEKSYHGGPWANARYIGTAICENAGGDSAQAYRNFVVLHAYLLQRFGQDLDWIHGHFQWNPAGRPDDPIGLFDWDAFLRDIVRELEPDTDPCRVVRMQLESAQLVIEALETKLERCGELLRVRERQLRQLREGR